MPRFHLRRITGRQSRCRKRRVVLAEPIPYDRAMRHVVAGFDVGGSKVALVVEDAGGGRAHRTVEATDTTSGAVRRVGGRLVYDGLARQLTRMLHTALEELHRSQLLAAGVVSAGRIHAGGLLNPANIVAQRVTPTARSAPLFFPLVEPLREAFHCPVELVNDCCGAVLGEVYDGLGKGVADKNSLHLAYVTISTGFGVGAWDRGHLVLGRHGNAGELGHLVIRPGGLRCSCGNLGCVEAYASGPGLVRNALARLHALDSETERAAQWVQLIGEPETQDTGSVVPDASQAILTPAMVFEAASRNDTLSVSVVEDLVFAAGTAFATIANAYDPEVISVGGGIALAHPELLPRIRAEMLRHLRASPPEVLLTPLGSDAGERGALAIARDVAAR